MKKLNSPLLYLLLISVMSLAMFNSCSKQDPTEFEDYYELRVAGADNKIDLTGIPEYTVTPSSFSLNMRGDQGNCGLHFLNFKEFPKSGKYDVTDSSYGKVAMVCVLENVEPRERLASFEGSFTIERINQQGISGKIDMKLKGPISSRVFTIRGKIESKESPLNLFFKK